IGGRNAHRTARVGPQRGGAQSSRHGSRRATARAPGSVAIAKWVAGASVMRIVVDGAQGAFLHVELAQDQGAVRPEPTHDLRIGAGERMGAAKTIAGRQADNIDIVLDGDRDAVEGPQTRLALSSEGCLLGPCLRLVLAPGEVAVEPAANTRGPPQIDVEQVA